MSKLSHTDEAGAARMVDVTAKADTARTATATGRIDMSAASRAAIAAGTASKGDVFAAARIAGIMAAKKTADLIPLCHPIALTKVGVEIAAESDTTIRILATAETTGQTGVEMEAMLAASTAALTLYDMAKAIDRAMVVSDICVLEKSGGKSGTFVRTP